MERVVGVGSTRGCDLRLAAVWAQCSTAALSETSAVREQAGPTRARGTADTSTREVSALEVLCSVVQSWRIRYNKKGGASATG